MGRAPCCEKVGLKKGPWTLEEDQKLTAYINEHGHGSWRALPKKAGLLRCGKSCRLRWTNYLRPDIKRGEFSSSEEQTIIQLHALLGNRWSAIATHLPKRTDNEIKNYWNTHLKKRLIKMGLDPATHKPQTLNTSSNNSNLMETPNNGSSSSSITHMAQWESVRLEAEARLAREAEMRAKGVWQPPPPARLLDSDRPHVKLDPRALANSDLLTSLKQICGGGMMSSKEEAGACNALDSTKLSAGALLTSHKHNPSALMMALKQEAPIATELVNSLHNWENSLQGQAGFMWPDSWKLCSNVSNSGEGQESSSCSSPSHATNYGSPTSTLCSLEQLSKHCSSYNSMPSTQARKLYWSDNYLHNAHNALNYSSKPLSFAQVDDGMQGVESIKGGCAESSLLGIPCMQELMQCEGYNNRSEDSLLIASNSSGFLSDLELVSEDISSSHQSSPGDASGGDIRQISYSALLGEEYPECEWNSVLKETEDAPILEDRIESPSL